jgi:hypothetical protein
LGKLRVLSGRAVYNILEDEGLSQKFDMTLVEQFNEDGRVECNVGCHRARKIDKRRQTERRGLTQAEVPTPGG